MKDVFLNKVQKSSNDFLIKEIYDSKLVDITFRGADKNRLSIIIDNTPVNTLVSKISNFSFEDSSNNKSNSLNSQKVQNMQKQNFEQKQNFVAGIKSIKSRDLTIYDRGHVTNSKIIELESSNENSSSDELISEFKKQNVQNASNRAQKSKSKNKNFVIEERSEKSRDNFLYDYRHASNRFWQEFEIFD